MPSDSQVVNRYSGFRPEVQGLRAIGGVFEHMFATLDTPHFVVTGRVLQGSTCFLTWDFCFRMRNFRRGQDQVIRGASQLVFDEAGRITLHRDYWDAAEELYMKLPVLGMLMRGLRRALAVPAAGVSP